MGVLAVILVILVIFCMCVYVHADFNDAALAHGRKGFDGIYGTFFFLALYIVLAILAEEYMNARGIHMDSGFLQTVVRELVYAVIARLICRLVIVVLKRKWAKR